MQEISLLCNKRSLSFNKKLPDFALNIMALCMLLLLMCCIKKIHHYGIQCQMACAAVSDRCTCSVVCIMQYYSMPNQFCFHFVNECFFKHKLQKIFCFSRPITSSPVNYLSCENLFTKNNFLCLLYLQCYFNISQHQNISFQFLSMFSSCPEISRKST